MMTGEITSDTSMTVIEGAIFSGASDAEDELSVSSVTVSGGQLTIEGTLTGIMSEGNGSFSDRGIYGSYPYSGVFSAESDVTPVSILTLGGNYTTLWGGNLTIGGDSFTLIDTNPNGSDCTYTGTITLKDPSQNVYSLSGTATASWLENPVPVIGVFTVTSKGLLEGGMSDGNGQECTSTVDSM